MPDRHAAADPVRRALAVSWLTVAWSTTTGMASAIVGLLSGNLSLAGLGVTVLIDMAASVVLIWRFRHERSGGSVERAEQVAHRVASLALIAFGVVLGAQAVRSLVGDAHPESSVAGAVLAGASVLVLPLLARRKYRAADGVGSAALRVDAHITSVSAAMAGVTLAGLAVRGLWGWTWSDAVAALILAVVAARQGLGGVRPARR